MAVSRTSLSNIALRHIGVSIITSPTEDNEHGRVLETLFIETLDEALIRHPWNFAITNLELNMLSETPSNEYTYAYQLPSNPYFLHLLSVDDGDTTDFAIEGRTLYTSNATAKIKYIYRLTDYNRMSPEFIDYFTTLLAYKISYSLTGSTSLRDSLAARAEYLLLEARYRNARQGVTPERSATRFSGTRS